MRYLLFIAALVLADQGLKYLVMTQIGLNNEVMVADPYFSLNVIFNDGAAFGMWSQHGGALVALTSFIMGGLLVYILVNAKKGNPLFLTILSMVTGGGIGNLTDRIRLGYVVDYLDFKIWPFIFNFADIWVVLGCFLLVIYLLASPSGKKPVKNRK